MPFNIYSDLQDHVTIRDIVKNWKNIGKPEKNKAIVELVFNMAGFTYEITMDEIKQAVNTKKYEELVKNVVEADFDSNYSIMNNKGKSKLINRFDLFVQSLVSTFDHTSGADWLKPLISFTEELIKNKNRMPDLVMVATFVRLIFVKHLSDLRARYENESELISSHAAVTKVLIQSCKLLFTSYSIGLQFKEFHEIYVDIGLSLYRSYPDFFILDWNQLEIFESLLTMDNAKTFTRSAETLRFLMEGNDIEDEEMQDDVRMEIIEYFKNNLDSFFIDIILHERVGISKEGFLLLIMVQRHIGSTPIITDKNLLTEIYESFMHENKSIRSLAIEYMQITMKPEECLDFILKQFEKYEAPIREIVHSTYDRSIYSQWETYGTFLESSRNKLRSITVTTEVIKQVITHLTEEYRDDEKRNEVEMHDAKIDLLDFFKVFPKFLFIHRETNPISCRYVKILGILDDVCFEELVEDVTEDVLKVLIEELDAALGTFDTFLAIEAIMRTFLKLRKHFKLFDEHVLELLVYHSSIFASGEINSDEDGVKFKRALYVVYVAIADKKMDLIPEDNFQKLFVEIFQNMTNDEFLDKVTAKGALLAVWAQILARCFKIVVNRAKETKQDDGEMNLSSVEHAIQKVLEKMVQMMKYSIESRTVILFSDMRLIMVNAGNLLHYLWILKKNTISEISAVTFSSAAKLTELMLIPTVLPEIFHIFVDFYDVHHNIIENHEEISHILQHFGQPSVHKHIDTMTQLLNVSYTRDNTEDKKVFCKTIAQTLISIKNNSTTHAESNMSLFWLSFREFTSSKLKMKQKEFLSFIANLSFEILQHQLHIPQTADNSVNRFQIFTMIPLIVEDMRKSSAVTTSVKEVFTTVQQKHENDFSPDENQAIKDFLKGFVSKKRNHASQRQEIESHSD